MDRRTAILTVASVSGLLHGELAQAQVARSHNLDLVLDGVEAINVHYRGVTASIRPVEIMAALTFEAQRQQLMK